MIKLNTSRKLCWLRYFILTHVYTNRISTTDIWTVWSITRSRFHLCGRIFFYCAAVTWLRLNGKLYGIFIRNIRVKILQTENASRKGNKIYKQHLSIYKYIAFTICRIYNSRTVYLSCIFRKQWKDFFKYHIILK